MLEIDDSGFKLKEGESGELPEDVREVWLRRIEMLLEDEPAEAIVALEIAAVLGGEIDPDEWSDACARAGISIPPALLPALLDVRLAYSEESPSWRFAHNMLRESLEEHARERRRYEAHHRLSAEMLAARHGVDRSGISERIGRHFLEGHSYAEALLPLYWAAIERWIASDYGRAQALLDDYERTLASLAGDNADPRWPECWVLRARIASMQGRYRDATTWSERARDHARYFKLNAPLAGALRERASIARALGDRYLPRPLLEEAELLLADGEDALGLGLLQLADADLIYVSGDLETAAGRYAAARDVLRDHGDWIGLLASLHGLGNTAYWRADREGARRLYQEELELAERTGNRHAYARARAALSDLLRLRGNLATAERGYREAIEILRAIGSSDVHPAMVALALLFLEAGDHAAAHRELMVVRPSVESIDEVRARCFIHAALAADAAAAGRWPECADQLSQTRALLDRTGAADGEVARTLEIAAELCHKAGRPEEAEQALPLARRVWTLLKRRSGSAP